MHLQKVVVGIKALNEERHIESAIVSALRCLKLFHAARPEFSTEVILADSGSSDRTIELASKYPIKIVQLRHPSERCCGAGAQLAYQHAFDSAVNGYFYLLDGDMILADDFLLKAIPYLEQHPDVAAIGGIVTEQVTSAQEFQIRADKARAFQAGAVDRLDCGGLYRSEAIRNVRYFADRNLHAFEEFDLGARLIAAGWKLHRVPWQAVDHYGHSTNGYKLLWRRFRSGYAGGCGEVLRASFMQPHFSVVMKNLAHVRHGIAVISWWAILLAALLFSSILLLPLLFLPLAFLVVRRRSLNLGVFSFVSWNVTAMALCGGLMRKRMNPTVPIASMELGFFTY